MDALEACVVELSANRLAGAVPETSGYGPLATLLNEVGRHLKPKVRCVINPANRGSGIPDGGFFVASQFQKGAAEPLPGQLPARGALEVKPVGDDLRIVSESEQVLRYLETYRQVLVTTYRGFVLVGYDADGQRRLLEGYALSGTEVGFWSLAASPRRAAAQHGERLEEFLKRCLLRQAQIASPQDLAWFLASYAREARARAEEHDLPALAATRAALEEARTWNGLASCASKGCLDITVSKEQRQRALRIMDGLVRYLEANGGGVEVLSRRVYSYGREEPTFATEALVGGERVGFALREHYGLLELRLTGERLHGLRRTWSDGKRQRLEAVLGGFVVGLGRAAAQLAEIHAADERRRRAWLEAERRRAEEAERRRLEEERIARLTGEATAWSRAAELRAYARGGCGCWTRAARLAKLPRRGAQTSSGFSGTRTLPIRCTTRIGTPSPDSTYPLGFRLRSGAQSGWGGAQWPSSWVSSLMGASAHELANPKAGERQASDDVPLAAFNSSRRIVLDVPDRGGLLWRICIPPSCRTGPGTICVSAARSRCTTLWYAS